jgi:hypothetical protein
MRSFALRSHACVFFAVFASLPRSTISFLRFSAPQVTMPFTPILRGKLAVLAHYGKRKDALRSNGCEMSEFGLWTTCTRSCGGGTHSRAREVVAAVNIQHKCGARVQSGGCATFHCPVDCVVTRLTKWGYCTATCGNDGIQYAHRAVISHPQFGGKRCPPLNVDRPCGLTPCAVDCTVSAWSQFTACSVASCGGGFKSRSRMLQVDVAAGGVACPVMEEEKPCNILTCPADCVVGHFYPWTPCSATCGSEGVQQRSREVLAPNHDGGKPCPPVVESRSCDSHDCPIDCRLSEWKSWSACSAKHCGSGIKSRVRFTYNVAQYGGESCSQHKTEEVEHCEKKKCIAVTDIFSDTPPKAQCVMTDWGEWGVCSVKCGHGLRHRQRSVLGIAPQGVACPSTADTKACVKPQCATDCVVSAFGTWGECSMTCGVGKRYRSRTVLTRNSLLGIECPHLAQEADCTNHVPCVVSCAVSVWKNTTECTKSCGGGLLHQVRTVTKGAESGGFPCPELTGVQACNQQPCLVGCNATGWSSWCADCSSSCGTGSRTRSRGVKAVIREGGACPRQMQRIACNAHPCPIDCVLGPWGSFGACDVTCGGPLGKMQRFRSIARQAAFGGRDCTDAASRAVVPVASKQDIRVDTRACDNLSPCATDCIMTAWSEWTECSLLCGDGLRSRKRNTRTSPTNGGVACGKSVASERCSEGPCASYCPTSPWSRWSPCSKSCGGGLRDRSRTALREKEMSRMHSGRVCPFLGQFQHCNVEPCPVDCALRPADEYAWDACDVTCGGGHSRRQRVRIVPAAHGGKGCPPLNEERTCRSGACPVDCKLSAFSHWSACDNTCGGGAQMRFRSTETAPLNGGNACAALFQTRKCEQAPCVTDCEVSAWGPLGPCSKTCSSAVVVPGTQVRTRAVVTSPLDGGKDCPALTESRECNRNTPCRQQPLRLRGLGRESTTESTTDDPF